jgi:hypothetical protein
LPHHVPQVSAMFRAAPAAAHRRVKYSRLISGAA